MHRVDPGAALVGALSDQDCGLVARAARTAGELGRRDLLPRVGELVATNDDAIGFWAPWAAVLLGDRDAAPDALWEIARGQTRYALRAMALFLRVCDPGAGYRFLQGWATQPRHRRNLIVGTGLVGDPMYAPWLLRAMSTLETARVAAEAFSYITGLDVLQGFDTPRPGEFDAEGAGHENVEVDLDEHLPWPDLSKVERWWGEQAPRFRAGTRHFLGKPVAQDHCLEVLRTGYQRQRVAATLILAVLQPATPLFPIAAPSWRQQRWLMSSGA